MALVDIREQIKTILSGIADIGVVHEYERWSADWGKFLDLFKTPDGKLHGWMFTRRRTPKSLFSQGLSSNATRTHLFVFRGIMGLQDAAATELLFQTEVEMIVSTFAGYDTLNGTCFTCSPTDNGPDGKDGIQVEVVENRMFGSVLCHYAELHLYVQEAF